MTVERILIPTDGSDYATTAIEYGIYIAKRLDAQLTGFHVIDIRLLQGPVFTDISGSVGLPAYQEFLPLLQGSLDERAEAVLHAFKVKCHEAGLRVETKKAIGSVDRSIIEEGGNTDLIIIARRGERLHSEETGLIGSTAESIVRNSGKPVMVTPEIFYEIESIGLAYDGSAPADKALTLAATLSEKTAWPITVIIITDNHELGAILTKKLEDFFEPRKIDSAIIILQGKEDREIIKFINERAVELMVMGAYGHNRLRELILGSTTSSVIKRSAIPVLLTR
ncbi:MAG TPA: universal stress protein [Syntrophales bacterium]|nr:universal stress protein [Syntrophales bacterium]